MYTLNKNSLLKPKKNNTLHSVNDNNILLQ